MKDRPLAGRRILVTRAAHQAGKLSEALRALGAEPVEVPILEIQPPTSFDSLDQALHQLDQFTWLIFTSANAVRALVERAVAVGVALARASGCKVAAVGEATASTARDAGFLITLVPESYVAESLVSGLIAHHIGSGSAAESHSSAGSGFVTGYDLSRAEMAAKGQCALALEGSLADQRILLARAAVARDVIPDALRAAGAHVDVVDAYQTSLPSSAPELLRHALAAGIDATTFTSSSSVTHLAEAAEKAGLAFPFPCVPAISIGPITSQTLREHNWPPAAEANPHDIPGLVASAASLFTSN